jgi:hypothetical protein
MARPLRKRKGFSLDGYGVFRKSIRLFAFTAESQRTQGKAIFFSGDTDKKNLPAPLNRFFAEGQRLIENRYLPILYKEYLAQ